MRDAERKFNERNISNKAKVIRKVEYKNLCNQFKRLLRKKERNYCSTLRDRIAENCQRNPREFWKLVNKTRRKQKETIPLDVYNADGTLNTNIEYVKKVWKDGFENLYRKPNMSHDKVFFDKALKQVTNYLRIPHINDITHISKEETKKAIADAKLNKACGPDFLPSEVFKNDESVDILHNLFEKCYYFGKVPTQWSMSIINPIPKGKHDRRDPLKYRGISLVSVVYKMYTSILNNRLIDQVGEKLVCEQNGFRKQRSCQDQIFSLTSMLDVRKSNGKDTFLTLIDFQKCFDYIDRTLLMKSLLDMGIDHHLFLSIFSIYEKTESVVKLNDNVYTDVLEVSNGVRQGCILSTTLTSVFLNSLLIEIKKQNVGIDLGDFIMSVLAYADDIAVVTENEHDMQILLNTISDWCFKWEF